MLLCTGWLVCSKAGRSGFIARRMLIAASEDIGNSNPNALLLAGECFRSVQAVGMPEARIILGQTAVYLATSAKSNSTYLAINKALELAEKTANLPVPLHLRNAPTKLMKQQGYGINYLYPHDYPEHFVLQDYLPPELKELNFMSRRETSVKLKVSASSNADGSRSNSSLLLLANPILQ